LEGGESNAIPLPALVVRAVRRTEFWQRPKVVAEKIQTAGVISIGMTEQRKI
jgi:hypothetical protein